MNAVLNLSIYCVGGSIPQINLSFFFLVLLLYWLVNSSSISFYLFNKVVLVVGLFNCEQSPSIKSEASSFLMRAKRCKLLSVAPARKRSVQLHLVALKCEANEVRRVIFNSYMYTLMYPAFYPC